MLRSKYRAIATLLLLIHVVFGRKCNVHNLVDEQCSENESCLEQDTNEGICKCLDGFKRLNVTTCMNGTKPERSTPNVSSLVDEAGSSSHVVAGILIPLCLIAIVIMAVYYSRKYRFVTWIKMRINQRNVSNYDEVMIGQDLDDDEPPLC